MSIGYCGYMNLIEADEIMLLYSYGCYNLNYENWEENRSKEDGEILIYRDALVESEIHHKIKRLPGGRKKSVEKKILRNFSLDELIHVGKITVKNASGVWKTHSNGSDVMATKLLFKLFNIYQESGEIPNYLSIFS